jgi:hypothetical protein
VSIVTKAQAELIELADRGMTAEKIAERIGKPVRVVRAQLTRVPRNVLGGDFTPTPLPIEVISRRKRIYLAGFDVFRPDAVWADSPLAVMLPIQYIKSIWTPLLLG